ncbi:MAG: hypothetical protein QXQ14_01520 [Candidatus Aenigmatarchaeota archaeon]
MNKYKYIKLEDVNENLEDGKYMSYGTVLDVIDNEVIFEENPKIKFLSIFKLVPNEFVRFFFSKNKDEFVIDFVNKLEDKEFFKSYLREIEKLL